MVCPRRALQAAVACLAITGVGARAAEDLAVLTPEEKGSGPDEIVRQYLRGLVHEALDRRQAEYEKVRTPWAIAVWQEEMRRFFLRQLGGFPERSPLAARVVEGRDFPDYRLEKVIYQSRPQFYVTALLYLPKSKPPYPGVLLPCGHSSNGKASEAYQRASILLAKNGIAVLCPDPVGQGERYQILGDGGRPPQAPTGEHMIAGVAPIPLGRNLAASMIWDEIRGIDYLVSRPEIDPARIGCTGNSGGGNRTSYLMALDERIVAAAPGCFLTTTRRKNESPGPGDAEQNIHAQIAAGMDHADYVLMRAPKPTLILAATHDFVPIEGAWENFREAKRWYSLLGFAERVDLIEADEKHGFTRPLRIAATRWMRRWLLGVDDAVTEGEFPVLSDAELQCTPEGQVLLLPGARSLFDFYAEEAERLAAERRRKWETSDREELLEEVRLLAGIRRLADIERPKCESRGRVERSGETGVRAGYHTEKLVIKPAEGVLLPALVFEPDAASAGACLYLHGEGKHVDAAAGGPIERLVLAGNTVLAVDLSGCGETRVTAWRYRGAASWLGTAAAEFFIAYMLDKSFVGMRAEDVLVCGRFLAERCGAERVDVVAVGEAGPAALHAVALEPQIFATLTLRRSLESWSGACRTRETKNVLMQTVHAALTVYDLPELVSVVGPRRIKVEEPIDAAGEPLP